MSHSGSPGVSTSTSGEVTRWWPTSYTFLRGNTLVADQLYVPFEELSDDELLTGVRRAATDKAYRVFFGLSFQFGSILNNVVNNRFPWRSVPRCGGSGRGPFLT